MLPLLQKDKSHRILLLLTFACVVLLSVSAFVVPPGVDPDSSWGFLVMRSMEHGSRFNLLTSPNPQNIAKNQSEFLSWWSPGQYLFPYLFKTLLKVNTGHAASLTLAICNLLGLAGFYKLFRQLGFTKWVAAISIAFIASQLFFLSSFLYYNGGEVLLFAFMGWFLYACFSFKTITWQLLVLLFFGLLLGFFSKSSVLWMYASGIICIWINISSTGTIHLKTERHDDLQLSGNLRKRISIWLKNGVLLTIPYICAFFVIYIFYLSRGASPISSEGLLLIKPETFSFPLASPMLSAFSIDELFDGLVYQPDGPVVSHNTTVFILIFLALCSLVFMVVITRVSPVKKYLIAMLTFYIVGVTFFSYMFLKQSAISYEARHFRIIGLLTIPGFIYLLLKTKITRVLFFVVWIIFIYKGYNYFKDEFNDNMHASRGNTGLSEQLYDAATFNEIEKIDRSHHNDAIFVVMSSDIAAEINNNRVITIETDGMTTEDLSELNYAGKDGAIYILMPEEYILNGKKADIIKSFTGYHQFTSKRLSADYCLYFTNN